MAGEYIEFNNNTQPAVNDTNLNLLQQLIKQDIQGAVSGDTLPVGTMVQFGSNIIPENWLLCDGSAVSRTTYQELFNTIGTSYGQGDGFTTFNLPDLRGRVSVGLKSTDTDFDTLGETGGSKELQEHTHKAINYVIGYTGGSQSNLSTILSGSSADSTPNAVKSAGTGDSGNLQPYIVTNYIIKATQSSGVVATVVDNLNSTSSTDALSAKQGKVLYEKITGEELYSGSTVVSQITLTKSLSNFNRIKVKYYIGSTVGCIEVPSPNGTTFNIIMKTSETTLLQIDAATWYASGTSLTLSDAKRCNLSTTVSTWDANNIIISKIIGFTD